MTKRIVLCVCGSMMVAWSFGAVLVFVVATVFGTPMITSFKIIFSSMAFKIKRSGSILQAAYNFITNTCYLGLRNQRFLSVGKHSIKIDVVVFDVFVRTVLLPFCICNGVTIGAKFVPPFCSFFTRACHTILRDVCLEVHCENRNYRRRRGCVCHAEQN